MNYWRLRIVVLADLRLGIRPGGVEVAKRHPLKSVGFPYHRSTRSTKSFDSPYGFTGT